MNEVRTTIFSNLKRDEAILKRRLFAALLRTRGREAEGCSVDLVPPAPGRRHGWCVELVRECPENPGQPEIRREVIHGRLIPLAALAAYSAEVASSPEKSRMGRKTERCPG